MRRVRTIGLLAILLAVASSTLPAANGGSEQAEAGAQFLRSLRSLYTDIGFEADLDFDAFRTAMVGFLNLRRAGAVLRDSVLTIIDYRKDSTAERMFVIDLEARRLLFRTLVAHGKNSGENRPVRFSNTRESKMSSLGFFVTDRTYYGKHGYSLKLKGLEPDYNTNALVRSIVIHGADYVSQGFIQAHGRLGLSWGCPAVPSELSSRIIDSIKGGSCLFILGEVADYAEKSMFQDFSTAAQEFAGDSPDGPIWGWAETELGR